MGSGDWSTDLSLGNLSAGNPTLGDLTPASAARPAEGHASKQDAPGAARRARQKEKSKEDSIDEIFSGEPTEHRLDHLA